MKSLIIIPAYNEEVNIENLLLELKEQVHLIPNCEILVVNDCSTDKTSAIARKLNCRVIDLITNLGYAGALKTGFRYAFNNMFDKVVTMDADGQHLPSETIRLLEELNAETDIIIGSRYFKGHTYKTTLARRVGQSFFKWLLWLFIRKRIPDITSGQIAYNSKVIETIVKLNLYPTDFPDANMLLIYEYLQFRIKVVSVKMIENITGKSMHSHISKQFYYVIKMLLYFGIIFLQRKGFYGYKN